MTLKIAPAGGVVLMFMISLPTVMYFYWQAWPVMLVIAARYVLRSEPKAVMQFYNFATGWSAYLYFALVDVMLEVVLGLKVAYTLVDSAPSEGDRIDKFLRKPSKRGGVKIIMMNHRTRVDWLFFFAILLRTDITATLKIVLKESLMKLPIVGWGMQMFRFLFLSRKWETDQVRFAELVRYFSVTEDTSTVLIFPEGTDLSPSNVEKAHKYATENGLPVFRHVLHPRTTGMVAIKNMFGVEKIEEIIDVTIGYTDFVTGERPSEASIVNGRFPRKVHVLCSRHHFDSAGGDIPSADEDFRRWIEQRFELKELLLSRFYTANPVGFVESDVREALGDSHRVVVVDEEERFGGVRVSGHAPGEAVSRAGSSPATEGAAPAGVCSPSLRQVLPNLIYFTRVRGIPWTMSILCFWLSLPTLFVALSRWYVWLWVPVWSGVSVWCNVKYNGFCTWLFTGSELCRDAKK